MHSLAAGGASPGCVPVQGMAQGSDEAYQSMGRLVSIPRRACRATTASCSRQRDGRSGEEGRTGASPCSRKAAKAVSRRRLPCYNSAVNLTVTRVGGIAGGCRRRAWRRCPRAGCGRCPSGRGGTCPLARGRQASDQTQSSGPRHACCSAAREKAARGRQKMRGPCLAALPPCTFVSSVRRGCNLVLRCPCGSA